MDAFSSAWTARPKLTAVPLRTATAVLTALSTSRCDSNKRILAPLNIRSILLFGAVSGAQNAEIKTRSTSYTGISFRPGDRELWGEHHRANRIVGPSATLWYRVFGRRHQAYVGRTA